MRLRDSITWRDQMKNAITRRVKTISSIAWCAAFASAVTALAQPASTGPSGLDRIKQEGVVRIGYRDNAAPFSRAGPDGRPQGYSIDLCHAIVEDLSAALGGRSLRIEYRPVTTEDRLDQVTRARWLPWGRGRCAACV